MATFRGLAALLLNPFITALASLGTTIGLLVFHQAEEKIQEYPKWWGRSLCRIAGVKVRIKGLENVCDDSGYIYCANHLSQYDIFSFQGYFPLSFRWLAKEELFTIPFLGKAMRNAGHIAINRGHGREAIKSLSRAADQISEGTSILVFPEGTRSRDGSMQTFKSGAMLLAIKSGAPLVPVAIAGSYSILPKGALLAQPGEITIRVGRPISVDGYGHKQKAELAELVQAQVEALL